MNTLNNDNDNDNDNDNNNDNNNNNNSNVDDSNDDSDAVAAKQGFLQVMDDLVKAESKKKKTIAKMNLTLQKDLHEKEIKKRKAVDYDNFRSEFTKLLLANELKSRHINRQEDRHKRNTIFFGKNSRN
jgi:hypothetical protein